MYDHRITGRIIRRMRLNKGMSQEVLSGFACISRSHLAMIEAGSINASVDTLWQIAEALGTRLSKIFKQVEQEKDTST